MASYYERHRAEVRAKQKSYYEKNRERFRQKNKAYRLANAAKIRKHLKKTKARRSVVHRRWRKRNLSRLAAKMRGETDCAFASGGVPLIDGPSFSSGACGSWRRSPNGRLCSFDGIARGSSRSTTSVLRVPPPCVARNSSP